MSSSAPIVPFRTLPDEERTIEDRFRRFWLIALLHPTDTVKNSLQRCCSIHKVCGRRINIDKRYIRRHFSLFSSPFSSPNSHLLFSLDLLLLLTLLSSTFQIQQYAIHKVIRSLGRHGRRSFCSNGHSQ